MGKVKQNVEEWLNEVSYDGYPGYVPSPFALDYVNFIKLVNGHEGGESNKTPVVHYKMMDELAGPKTRLANLCSRGFGKTVLFGEYLVLYIAVFGGIEGFGKIEGMIYISDSMENGAKSLRNNIEHRYNNSPFLQQYLPKVKFTDPFIQFENIDGVKSAVRLFGAKTGLRGTKIYGKRPVLAIMDDLVSDSDADSPTVMRAIKNTVYRGVDYALDSTRRKIVFSGTPFNKSDILYEAVESGGWYVNVYPICEKFPCKKEEFRGAWEDRFSYEFVKEQYDVALSTGEIASFNQELMLRIMSDDDRLIQDSDISWYKETVVKDNRERFNYYITTDFATSEQNHACLSILFVWALNQNGDWMWVDGVARRQNMGENIDDLFRFASEYKPMGVGVEVTGQQGGFIDWIQSEMGRRNVVFTLTSDKNSNFPGIRPNTNKMQRFQTVVPLFKQKKIMFPMEQREGLVVSEIIEELSLAAEGGFRSKYKDAIDGISMLSVMRGLKPSDTGDLVQKEQDGLRYWDDEDARSDSSAYASYLE